MIIVFIEDTDDPGEQRVDSRHSQDQSPTHGEYIHGTVLTSFTRT